MVFKFSKNDSRVLVVVPVDDVIVLMRDDRWSVIDGNGSIDTSCRLLYAYRIAFPRPFWVLIKEPPSVAPQWLARHVSWSGAHRRIAIYLNVVRGNTCLSSSLFLSKRSGWNSRRNG